MRKSFCLRFISVVLFFMLPMVSSLVSSKEKQYELLYKVLLSPDIDGAEVEIRIDSKNLLKSLRFTNKDIYSDVNANGLLKESEDFIEWELPSNEVAILKYKVKLTREKGTERFDALVNEEWAIFRGDNLIPAVRTVEVGNAAANAKIEFILPEQWKSVETGWPLESKKNNVYVFRVDNPERLFDRPIGWIIAGKKLGIRYANIKSTNVVVAAPRDQGMRRMDALVFFNFIWPEMSKAFAKVPEKLLVVGAGNPMWRGGLSAPNSLFLHADRPLVTEDGTSPLIHELVHMVTRISGQVSEDANDDWIAEGVAEFYSIELLYRAGGMTKSRRAKIYKGLKERAADISDIRKGSSSGDVTARAVIVLDELDKELKASKKNLDIVIRDLMLIRNVSLDDLKESAERHLKKESNVLKAFYETKAAL